MIDRERRFFHSELRIDGTEKPTITGHAAVFHQKSEEIFGIHGMREIIRPGAFSKALRTSDVRALLNHDANFVLGRTKNRTLELSEDGHGLAVRIHPPDTIFANDILESIKRGDIDQMSFGFRMAPDGEKWHRNGTETIREIIEVEELFDVSPVTFPAYPQTDVQARSYFETKIKELDAPPIQKVKDRTAFLDQFKNDNFLARLKAAYK
jgi:HK97 family phage prohead protease